MARNADSVPGLGISLGKGNVYPSQYSGLENYMGCIVHGVAKKRTRLSNFYFHTFIFLSQLTPFHLLLSFNHTAFVVLLHVFIMNLREFRRQYE